MMDEIHQFMVRHVNDVNHAMQVERLSLQLFDQLSEIHQCSVNERFLLQAAAALHDIGLAVSYSKHHVHSMQIIINAEFSSISDREKRVIANIARYHRKSFPKMKHHEFISLDPIDQQNVRKMSALLRIADAMDRSHGARILDIQCSIKKNSCSCDLLATEHCMEELARIGERKELFLQVYGIGFKIGQTNLVTNIDSSNSSPDLLNECDSIQAESLDAKGV